MTIQHYTSVAATAYAACATAAAGLVACTQHRTPTLAGGVGADGHSSRAHAGRWRGHSCLLYAAIRLPTTQHDRHVAAVAQRDTTAMSSAAADAHAGVRSCARACRSHGDGCGHARAYGRHADALFFGRHAAGEWHATSGPPPPLPAGCTRAARPSDAAVGDEPVSSGRQCARACVRTCTRERVRRRWCSPRRHGNRPYLTGRST
jgi:hypothetical protein